MRFGAVPHSWSDSALGSDWRWWSDSALWSDLGVVERQCAPGAIHPINPMEEINAIGTMDLP